MSDWRLRDPEKEAARFRALRTKKRGRPPRPYHKSHEKYKTSAGTKNSAPGVKAKRGRAIGAAWDDPLRRALMRAKKTKNETTDIMD